MTVSGSDNDLNISYIETMQIKKNELMKVHVIKNET